MPECSSIDTLVTPYVDGELAAPDRRAIEQHLGACPPCRSRVDAERAVRNLLQVRKAALHLGGAPPALHARCAQLAREQDAGRPGSRRGGATAPQAWRGVTGTFTPAWRALAWRTRVAPLALAAALMLLVGGAFVYRVTGSSDRVLAAELTADHVKCFALNAVLGTRETPSTVESSVGNSFGWNVHLPEDAAREGLELVGSRPCLYGQGRVAHIMYRHNGRPVSLFMLPRTSKSEQLIEVFGHEAAIWSVANRTFVLISSEPRSEVQRMAAFVHAAFK
jgi:anti-sigma factor RsiW